MKHFPTSTHAPGLNSQSANHALLLIAALAALIVPSGLFAAQAPVNLGSAGNYVVLSKTGITDVPPARITGNIAASPITGAAIGVTCAEVTGTISAVDATGPAPCSLVAPLVLTQAILDMQTAYTNAAGRTLPDFTELGAGNISGKTLAPGLYKWSNSVLMDTTGVALSGSPNDVWIFQIAGDLTVANNARVTLSGGAQANNIFWQVGGPTGVLLGTTSVMYGNLLSAKQVILNTGATLNGRAFAQTQVTLQAPTVTSPGPLVGGIPPIVPGCSFNQQPVIYPSGIVNAANWTSPVAAGSIVALFGDNFGNSFSATTYPLLPTMGATSVQAGGLSAPLYMTSCNQINVQIPWESAGAANVSMTVLVGVQFSAAQLATVATFAPGIFTMNQTGSGQGAVEVALTGYLAAPTGTFSAPVARGQYVAIYCTGLGPVSNQPATGQAASANPLSVTPTKPTVTIGGVPATVTFSGLAPGMAGLYQVNALVPASVAPGSAVTLVMAMGGIQSNTVTIAVQ